MIQQLHHSKHHQTYVNSLNEAEEKYAAALHAGDVTAQIALQPALKFHGGYVFPLKCIVSRGGGVGGSNKK